MKGSESSEEKYSRSLAELAKVEAALLDARMQHAERILEVAREGIPSTRQKSALKKAGDFAKNKEKERKGVWDHSERLRQAGNYKASMRKKGRAGERNKRSKEFQRAYQAYVKADDAFQKARGITSKGKAEGKALKALHRLQTTYGLLRSYLDKHQPPPSPSSVTKGPGAPDNITLPPRQEDEAAAASVDLPLETRTAAEAAVDTKVELEESLEAKLARAQEIREADWGLEITLDDINAYVRELQGYVDEAKEQLAQLPPVEQAAYQDKIAMLTLSHEVAFQCQMMLAVSRKETATGQDSEEAVDLESGFRKVTNKGAHLIKASAFQKQQDLMNREMQRIFFKVQIGDRLARLTAAKEQFSEALADAHDAGRPAAAYQESTTALREAILADREMVAAHDEAFGERVLDPDSAEMQLRNEVQAVIAAGIAFETSLPVEEAVATSPHSDVSRDDVVTHAGMGAKDYYMDLRVRPDASRPGSMIPIEPVATVGQRPEIALGDTHANVVKEINFLAAHGLIDFEGDTAAAKDAVYQELRDVYAVFESTDPDKETLSFLESEKLQEARDRFEAVLDKMQVTDRGRSTDVRLMGDEWSDRGANDLIVFLFRKWSQDNGMQVKANVSDHGMDGLARLERLDEPPQAKRFYMIEGDTVASFKRMEQMIRAGLITKEEVRGLFQEAVLPHYQLFGASWQGDQLVISSHGVASIDTVFHAAEQLGVDVADLGITLGEDSYYNFTPEQMEFLIDKVNERFSEALQSGPVTQKGGLYDYAVANANHSMVNRGEYVIREEHPIIQAVWAYELSGKAYERNKEYIRRSDGRIKHQIGHVGEARPRVYFTTGQPEEVAVGEGMYDNLDADVGRANKKTRSGGVISYQGGVVPVSHASCAPDVPAQRVAFEEELLARREALEAKLARFDKLERALQESEHFLRNHKEIGVLMKDSRGFDRKAHKAHGAELQAKFERAQAAWEASEKGELYVAIGNTLAELEDRLATVDGAASYAAAQKGILALTDRYKGLKQAAREQGFVFSDAQEDAFEERVIAIKENISQLESAAATQVQRVFRGARGRLEARHAAVSRGIAKEWRAISGKFDETHADPSATSAAELRELIDQTTAHIAAIKDSLRELGERYAESKNPQEKAALKVQIKSLGESLEAPYLRREDMKEDLARLSRSLGSAGDTKASERFASDGRAGSGMSEADAPVADEYLHITPISKEEAAKGFGDDPLDLGGLDKPTDDESGGLEKPTDDDSGGLEKPTDDELDAGRGRGWSL